MGNETQKIFESQLKKLPADVVSFLTSSNWSNSVNEIASQYKLDRDEVFAFEREVTLALAGLTHPDFFREILEKEVSLSGEVLDSISREVGEKIFSPIRQSLVSFFEKENPEIPDEESMPIVAGGEGQTRESVLEPLSKAPYTNIPPIPNAPKSITGSQTSNIPRMPDVAPDNLPTEEPYETEPLIPPITPKNQTDNDIPPVHPFEEKMKRVFTAGTQSIEDLSIEPRSPEPTPTPTPTTPRPIAFDPYREQIE